MRLQKGVREQQWRHPARLDSFGTRSKLTALADATFLLAPTLSRILPGLCTNGRMTLLLKGLQIQVGDRSFGRERERQR